MFRKIVIGAGSFVGIALIVLSFLDRDVPTAPSGPEEVRSGQLQLDTVPLGALTLVADGVAVFKGQVHVPGVVVDLPYISHPSLNRVFDYAVGFQNGVPLFDLFIRDGRLRPAFSLLHCRPGQGYVFI